MVPGIYAWILVRMEAVVRQVVSSGRLHGASLVEEGEKEDIRSKMKRINFTHISQLLQKSLNVIFEKVRYDNPLDDELPF